MSTTLWRPVVIHLSSGTPACWMHSMTRNRLQAMTETTGRMSSVKNLPDLIFTTALNKYALPSRQWKDWKPAEAVSLEGHFCWKVRTKLKVCAPPSKRPLQRLQGAPYKTCSYTPFLLDAMWKFDPFSPDASQRVMQLCGTYSAKVPTEWLSAWYEGIYAFERT